MELLAAQRANGRPGAAHSVGNDRMYAEQSERLMESQNDALTARLADKVGLLKQMSIDIGVEVKEQNRMLTDMDADMESTQGFMKKTLGSLQNMVRHAGDADGATNARLQRLEPLS
jgi:blocked-early-in-transport protein 1